MTATTTPDTDCNRVSYFPEHPNHTHRCNQPEGHTGHCWLIYEPQTPKHRLPVPTDEDPFGIRPPGGKHKARPLFIGAASGPNRVDSELRRRLAQVQS